MIGYAIDQVVNKSHNNSLLSKPSTKVTIQKKARYLAKLIGKYKFSLG
jgi:hypothetical protein